MLPGNTRLAQIDATTEYFLDDALGSVRQMGSTNGSVTLARSYDPFGVVRGNAQLLAGTSYGFTGEYTETTAMLYLSARHYAPTQGRFMTRDTLSGDANRPLSLNRWNYVNGNPVNFSDPSGHDPNCFPIPLYLCADRRLMEIISKDHLTAGKNGFTMVALFEDRELAQLWHISAGSTTSSRLEWVLD